MTYPATNSKEASELLIDVSNQMHEIVNEDAATEIITESGPVPSVRKALADTFLFQDPIAWDQGGDETAFNQLRTFEEGIYWAPSATVSNPIPMGATPIGDSNWRLAPVNPRGYKGLWPETGGSALKGETWQTQVGGTPTGQYFTALQNTTVDPVGDNVNWREVVSPRSLDIWNVKRRGVSPEKSVSENTTRLNEAINEARSQGVTALTIDEDITVTDTLDRKGSVAFIGNGKITGLYRKNVAKLTAPTGSFFQDVEPSEHLKRFSIKSDPVVVIVGDSISTEIADVNGKTASIWSLLQEKITSDNPSKNITFYNRAIGGQTYFTAVGVPVGGTLPDWYDDPNKAWPLYVGELEPDLVIFHFGMNDGDGSFQSSTIRQYVDSLLPNSGIFPGGIPDVVYCTNLTPAVDAQVAGFGDKAGQSGRDFVAGYTRTFAKNRGYGLIDVHRNCCIVKDGFDPLSTSLERIGAVVPTAGAVAASESCRDFKWDLTVSQLSASEPLSVKLGASEVTDNTGRGSFAIISESGGYFVVDLYSTVTDFYHSTTTTALVPPGSFSLSVERKGSTLNIAVDGTTVFNYEKLVTHGSEFVPKAGDSTYQAGNITAATFFRGVETIYKTQIANDEMWGGFYRKCTN